MKKKPLPVLIIGFAVLTAVFSVLYFGVKPELEQSRLPHVPYQQFYKSAAAGAVTKAVIRSDSIVYTEHGSGGTDEQYVTQNPKSPLLKELLMRNGIEVTEETDAGDIVSGILDYLFYIIFFGVI